MVPDLRRGLDAAQFRHDDVHQHDIGIQPPRLEHRFAAVGRGGDDLDAAFALQDRPQSVPHQRTVAGSSHGVKSCFSANASMQDLTPVTADRPAS